MSSSIGLMLVCHYWPSIKPVISAISCLLCRTNNNPCDKTDGGFAGSERKGALLLLDFPGRFTQVGYHTLPSSIIHHNKYHASVSMTCSAPGSTCLITAGIRSLLSGLSVQFVSLGVELCAGFERGFVGTSPACVVLAKTNRMSASC